MIFSDRKLRFQNNATPVFVDVENKTFTIDPQKLEDKNKIPHYKAVIAVDYGTKKINGRH